MWKEGSIRVNGEVFHYWMKQYDKGSEWGIDGAEKVSVNTKGMSLILDVENGKPAQYL